MHVIIVLLKDVLLTTIHEVVRETVSRMFPKK